MKSQPTLVETDLSPESIKEILASNPKHALIHYSHLLTSEDIEYVCRVFPGRALEFGSHLLNPSQFDHCCRWDTLTGLLHFPERIKQNLFAACVKENPDVVLCWFEKRLTKRQFAFCIHREPELAMIGMDCWTRMTIKQQNFCIWKRPARALEWVGWLLTGRQFAYCVSSESLGRRCFAFRADWVPGCWSASRPTTLRKLRSILSRVQTLTSSTFCLCFLVSLASGPTTCLQPRSQNASSPG